MQTFTATEARSRLFNLIKNIIRGHRQVRITSKKGSAILLAEDDYENLLETIELLSVPGFKQSIEQADKDIENGDTLPLEKVL
jgi:antitoxin YefM